MGVLNRLFGAHETAEERLGRSLASMIAMADAMLNIKGMLAHPGKRRVVAGYFFGFADITGQMKGLSTDATLGIARTMFRTAFGLTDAELHQFMQLAMECSQTPGGSPYLQAGAQSLARFTAKESGTPVGKAFLDLIAAVA